MAGKLTIRWRNDPQLSAIHAAYVVATDAACADKKTHQVLVRPATEINHRLLSASLDVATFWERLFAEYAFDPGNTRACEIALIDAGCSELQLDQTASAISSFLGECRIAFQQRFPKLSEQLELRGKPMKENWSQIGTNLLSEIANQIWRGSPPDDWWPSKVDGLLVHPMRGGDGSFDAETGKFWVEAVVNAPDPDVPEVLRVAWLLTQIAIERQVREQSSESATGMPWGLGAVPLVLDAAVKTSLISAGESAIHAALRLWRLGDEASAATIANWWQQWQSNASPMPIALKALGRMLADEERPGSGINLLEFPE